jgi:flagellar basal body-associated protein FliL
LELKRREEKRREEKRVIVIVIVVVLVVVVVVFEIIFLDQNCPPKFYNSSRLEGNKRTDSSHLTHLLEFL